ncbi:MAG: uroporphyrinogen decarboxylase family protein [Saccharofermentanales bacterium]
MRDLSVLIGKVQEAYNTPENNRKIDNPSRIKLIIGLGRTVLSETIGFDMDDYFRDAKTCLQSQLEWKLLWHERIKDDTVLDLRAGLDYSTAFEPSFFGQKPLFNSGREPTYGAGVLSDIKDFRRLDVPDFYKSGLMPEAHRMYDEMCGLAKGRLDIFFPGWARGPWSIATMLRGFEGIFLDAMDSPEELHGFMAFIVACRESWEKQRCSFLGISPQDRDYKWKYVVYRILTSSDIFEDEVDGNLFSPEFFETNILPYVEKLNDFYNGHSYYHSCGNMTPFLPFIKRIGVQDYFQVSPWSDYEKMVDELPESVIIQKALHPFNDVIKGTDESMRYLVKDIISKAKGRKVEIWADALYEGGESTVEKAELLVKIFREETEKFD